MKKILSVAVAVILLAGCSTFEASIGIGYRKCPPGFEHPILPDPSLMKATMNMLTPAEWDAILKILTGDTIKALFPANNRVDLGVWTEIRAKK